jgi:hypothetical protein
MIDISQKLKEARRGSSLKMMINYIKAKCFSNGANQSHTGTYSKIEGRDKIG